MYEYCRYLMKRTKVYADVKLYSLNNSFFVDPYKITQWDNKLDFYHQTYNVEFQKADDIYVNSYNIPMSPNCL